MRRCDIKRSVREYRRVILCGHYADLVCGGRVRGASCDVARTIINALRYTFRRPKPDPAGEQADGADP
jgi:hypothetical protein